MKNRYFIVGYVSSKKTGDCALKTTDGQFFNREGFKPLGEKEQVAINFILEVSYKDYKAYIHEKQDPI